MKTKSFCTIEVESTAEGSVLLLLSTPMGGQMELEMTPDELMIFLTETCNKLYDARLIEVRKEVEKDIERERRKL